MTATIPSGSAQSPPSLSPGPVSSPSPSPSAMDGTKPKGGRPRKDGLPPGSQAAKEKDANKGHGLVPPLKPPKVPAGRVPKPHGNELPPPALTPESRAAAITRNKERLRELINEAKKQDPAAKNWKDPDTLFVSTGTPVRKSAWRPLVAVPVRIVEWFFGVEVPTPKPDHVTDDEIDEAAGYWEDASKHLGFSEAGAAYLGATAGTLSTVGSALGRGFKKWWKTLPKLPRRPKAGPGPQPGQPGGQPVAKG